LPAASTRRTAASLHAGSSSRGPGRHGATAGRATETPAAESVVSGLRAGGKVGCDAGIGSDDRPAQAVASTPNPAVRTERRGSSTRPA
jgi:hypothetical protein